ncbi:MAG: VTT domain-containing protein [Crocinitomicaceae bacterium]|nr:VTT domain-containing protein [Crocinitomicaceae bacterium]
MDILFDFFQHLIDPDWIMKNGGLYLVVLILFIETGVIFGFILPGDPLLFISGMVIASAKEMHYPFSEGMFNLPFWMILFMISTILGNYFGYWFGYRFKYLIDREKDSWLIKKKHVATAKEFYEKKGGFTIAIARFLPIIRTFAPIIAGTVKMDIKKFSYYNIIGATLWVGSLMSLGYILGDSPWVKRNLEYIILGIILLVTLPVITKFIFKRKS